jgi:hypothetical protein
MYTLALQWWSEPLIAANNNARFAPGVFDLPGSVPVLYSVFALALGVAAGALIRRAIPAMGATLMVSTSVRVAVEFLLRPSYQHALTDTYSLSNPTQAAPASESPGMWLTSANTVDKSGHIVGIGTGIDFTKIVGECPNLASPKRDPPVTGGPAGVAARGRDVPDGRRYWMFSRVSSRRSSPPSLSQRSRSPSGGCGAKPRRRARSHGCPVTRPQVASKAEAPAVTTPTQDL